MMKFRTRLAELRQQFDLSRMDIVRQADMTYPTVMSWENDSLSSIDSNKLFLLMEIFKLNKIDDILFFVDENNTESTQTGSNND